MPVGSANQTLRNDAGNWVVSNSVMNDELNNFLITGITLRTTMDAEINGLLVGKGAGQKTENTVLGINSMFMNSSGVGNTALGYDALRANLSGSGNTASGAYALKDNQVGGNNTATGSRALSSNNTGNQNTAVGSNALSSNTTGNQNAAIGMNALSSNISGNQNAAIGMNALSSNTTGDLNTASGYGAMLNNTSGGLNTAYGSEALYYNTTGFGNTASGHNGLNKNATGSLNTASGHVALEKNTTGGGNTASGSSALNSNTTGNQNTAVGSNALSSNTTGNNNTAVGYDADVQNFNLTNSTAIGYQAEVTTSNTIKLGNSSVTAVITDGGIQAGGVIEAIGTIKAGSVTYPNTAGILNQVLTTDGMGAASWQTTGISAIAGVTSATLRHNGTTWVSDINVLNDGTTLRTTSDAQINGITVGKGNLNVFANTAIGFKALNACQPAGQQNTAIGRSAMMNNQTGRENTATGKESLATNTTGKYNSAFGWQSLFDNLDGENNTAAGYQALKSNTNGDNNTAVGKLAGSTGNFSNTTTIGYAAVATGDDQVRIGNTAVMSIGGFRGWSNFSDARFKKNIEENVIGLDFILALRPVTYNIDTKSIENFRETPSELRLKESERKVEEILQTGFIAQEVELAANKLGYDFSGVDPPQNDKDNYSLRYSEFVVPLVKAMQEQQELILKLQERISVLEKK